MVTHEYVSGPLGVLHGVSNEGNQIFFDAPDCPVCRAERAEKENAEKDAEIESLGNSAEAFHGLHLRALARAEKAEKERDEARMALEETVGALTAIAEPWEPYGNGCGYCTSPGNKCEPWCPREIARAALFLGTAEKTPCKNQTP